MNQDFWIECVSDERASLPREENLLSLSLPTSPEMLWNLQTFTMGQVDRVKREVKELNSSGIKILP